MGVFSAIGSAAVFKIGGNARGDLIRFLWQRLVPDTLDPGAAVIVAEQGILVINTGIYDSYKHPLAHI